MTYDPAPGTHILAACEAAIALAREHDTFVDFTFNGVELRAGPTMDAATLADYFYAAVQQRAKVHDARGQAAVVTPTCHRTLAIPRATPGPDGMMILAKPEPCIGSRCAMWVPETKGSVYHEGSRRYGTGAHPHAAECQKHEGGTGKGWCAENLRRAPWDDPAPKEPTP